MSLDECGDNVINIIIGYMVFSDRLKSKLINTQFYDIDILTPVPDYRFDIIKLKILKYKYPIKVYVCRECDIFLYKEYTSITDLKGAYNLSTYDKFNDYNFKIEKISCNLYSETLKNFEYLKSLKIHNIFGDGFIYIKEFTSIHDMKYLQLDIQHQSNFYFISNLKIKNLKIDIEHLNKPSLTYKYIFPFIYSLDIRNKTDISVKLNTGNLKKLNICLDNIILKIDDPLEILILDTSLLKSIKSLNLKCTQIKELYLISSEFDKPLHKLPDSLNILCIKNCKNIYNIPKNIKFIDIPCKYIIENINVKVVVFNVFDTNAILHLFYCSNLEYLVLNSTLTKVNINSRYLPPLLKCIYLDRKTYESGLYGENIKNFELYDDINKVKNRLFTIWYKKITNKKISFNIYQLFFNNNISTF